MRGFFMSIKAIKAGCIGVGIFCFIASFQWIILKIEPQTINYILPSIAGFISGLYIQFFKTKWEKEAIKREKEKLETTREITGAICHEMNQPLQAIYGNLEILLLDLPRDNIGYRNLINIQEQVDRMGKVTKKMMGINKYKTKNYLAGKIVDFDNSSF